MPSRLGGHSTVIFWLDFVDQPLCLEFVRQSLGRDWEAGSKVLVGNATCPLRVGEQREVADGTLVRIFLPRRRIFAAATLLDKMGDPAAHFRYLETEGPPDVAIDTGAFGLLQPLVVDKIVPYSGEQESPLFASVMLSHADMLARPLEVVRPLQASLDVEIRGRPIRDLVGVFPAAHATHIPVFLDCRDLGHPLRLVAAQQGHQPLFAFLQQTGLHLEDPVVTDVSQQRLVLRANDVVRLSRKVSLGGGLAEFLPDVGDISVSSSAVAGTDGRRACSGRLASLAGQACAVAGSSVAAASSCRPCSRFSAQPACLDFFGLGNAASMWNLGSVPPALSSRPSRDTSACRVEAVWSPTAEFRRLELEYRLAMSTLASPLIVYDAGEAPVRDYFVPREPLPAADGDPPVDDALSESGSDEPAPSMNCVAIAIFVFQRPVRWTSAWVHLDEPLDSFLTRVDILHNPTSHAFLMVPVSPHPHVPYFAFLCVPRWWEAACISPQLWQVRLRVDEPMLTFLHTASHGETFEDVLPSALLQEASMLSLFVPPAADTDAAPACPTSGVLDVLPPGAPVAVLAPDAGPPAFVGALEHLRALPHSTAHWEVPAGSHDPPYCAVLLGVDYEQFLVVLQPGPTLPQLAAALNFPPEHLFVHLQMDVFDELVVASHSVGVCYGFRDKRVFGACPRGRGLFIDGRAVGRPVCYRTYLQRTLTPLELCLFLGIAIPDAYEPMVAGPASLAEGGGFSVEHGDTVILWLAACSPPSSPASANAAADAPPDADFDSDADDADGGDGTGPDGSGSEASPGRVGGLSDHGLHLDTRSRSPRGRGHKLLDVPMTRSVPAGHVAALRAIATPCRVADSLPQCHSADHFPAKNLDFKSLLPDTCQGSMSGLGLDGYVDWLDADVSTLLRDPGLPASLHWRLAGVRSFWQAPYVQEELLALHVYTDGSALGSGDDGYVQDCAVLLPGARLARQCSL